MRRNWMHRLVSAGVGIALGLGATQAAWADHSTELLDEILAARANRENAIAGASVVYKVRAPDTGWHEGYWSSSPAGDVHALGPLPPHALFEQDAFWPVATMTHEVRQSAGERFWLREDTGAETTEVAIEPSVTTMHERLAGHPMVYDLVVDRWLANDTEILVEATTYNGQPAAYIRTSNNNEAWLLADYDWAVAEMRDWSHDWIARAAGFDRVPLLEGSAPQRLQWFLDDALVLELELQQWEGTREDATYGPYVDAGSGAFHVIDRRVSPASTLDLASREELEAYLAQGLAALGPQAMPELGPHEAERIAWVMDATRIHENFNLDDLPWMAFDSFEDEGEHFGYLVNQDPRLEEFTPLRALDVVLTVDGEEWRPQSQDDIGWLLGRMTWFGLWDQPFAVTVLRDGELLEFEVLWSYDQVSES